METEQESRSVSGPRSFWFWATAFGVYLVGSLAIVSGIAHVTDLYAIPAEQREIKVKLIIAAISIVLLGAGFALAVHVAREYRKRYHLHRDKGLVRDLYPDRNHLIGSYKDILHDAQRIFRVAGISLHTLMSDRGFEEELKRSLAEKKGLHIHLVFLKAYSAFVGLKEKMEKRSVGRISTDITSNFGRALELKDQLGEAGARLHVYQVDALPAGFTLQRDEEIYFEPYLDTEIGRTCPTFVMGLNNSNHEVFAKFSKNIDDLVSRSNETLIPTGDIGAEITSFGRSDARKTLRKAVFLDRDGTLLHDPGYLADPQNINLYESACETIRSLNKNFRIVIVTNQSGVARGFFTESDLKEIHRRLIAILDDNDAHVDGIFYCPHHPTEGIGPYRKICECRKPKSGLLEIAAKTLGIDFSESYMVGDSESDVEAGNAVRATSILVNHAKGNQEIHSAAKYVVSDVSEVIGIVEKSGQVAGKGSEV